MISAYQTYKIKSAAKIIQTGSIIACVLIIVVAFFVFISSMVYRGDIGYSQKYTELKYQEFLMKHPDYKMYVNGEEITRYDNKVFDGPIILQLNTSGGAKYEAFLDGNTEELIGNELLVYIKRS